ncbi:MAG: hypothetical protein H0U77_08905 [Nocardioidaceae bacterium]|nr:hypothetical protein [Nocardioidaceae bacterium]
MASASLNAPDSGERASRIVFAPSGLPFFVPPPLASARCQATTTSAVTSRTFRGAHSGRA